MTTHKDAEEIKKTVQDRYAEIARQKLEQAPSCCPPVPRTACCGPQAKAEVSETRAQRLYEARELEGLPESVTEISLGCGNPTAIAELKEGEVVLDLGSGGGIDCFLAARKVGDSGKVIGLDMTPEMIQLARSNAEKLELKNVEFRLGEMEHMPMDSSSINVIISNCVINLSPDKDAVFREAYRVLKPGGRICVSDIVLLGELPDEVKNNVNWAACIAGALRKDVYLDKIRAARFQEVEVEEKSRSEPSTMSGDCCSNSAESQPDWRKNVTSIRVKASKPR